MDIVTKTYQKKYKHNHKTHEYDVDRCQKSAVHTGLKYRLNHCLKHRADVTFTRYRNSHAAQGNYEEKLVRGQNASFLGTSMLR